MKRHEGRKKEMKEKWSVISSAPLYSRAQGIADHYWPRAVFFPYLN